MGGNGDGVQTRQRGAPVEQDQTVAHQLALGLRDDQAGMGSTDHPLETARREPVMSKALVFQFQQRLQVIVCRLAKYQIHIAAVKVA